MAHTSTLPTTLGDAFRGLAEELDRMPDLQAAMAYPAAPLIVTIIVASPLTVMEAGAVYDVPVETRTAETGALHTRCVIIDGTVKTEVVCITERPAVSAAA